MSKVRTVEVAIIGAGSAGMRAYRTVSRHTDSVVLIEGGAYGTTCARVGCMPSKLLIAAAEAAHTDSHSAEFGVIYGDKKIDGKSGMNAIGLWDLSLKMLRIGQKSSEFVAMPNLSLIIV